MSPLSLSARATVIGLDMIKTVAGRASGLSRPTSGTTTKEKPNPSEPWITAPAVTPSKDTIKIPPLTTPMLVAVQEGTRSASLGREHVHCL